MEIMIKDLKACERGIIKLMNSDLPARTSYKLTVILKTIRDSLQNLDQIRTDLVKKYGVQGKDGIIRIQPGTDEEMKFREEFEPILEETVFLDKFKPLSIEDIAEARISPVELEPLLNRFVMAPQAVPEAPAGASS